MNEIPFFELGENENTLLFSHANAYPPQCYQQLLNTFSENYTIICPEHRPLWGNKNPASRDWSIFADDLIHFCEINHLKKLTAIGHSLGAVALWLVKKKRPDLIQKLILIDPVLLPRQLVRWNLYLPFTIKKTYVPIIKTALKRRDKWNTLEEARNHFKRISIFKRFSDPCFDDFINFGLKDDKSGGITLTFPKVWEAWVYGSVQNCWKLFDKEEKDIAIIRAEFSDVLSRKTWVEIQTLMPLLTYIEVKDVYHMLPMEIPQELGKIIKDVI